MKLKGELLNRMACYTPAVEVPLRVTVLQSCQYYLRRNNSSLSWFWAQLSSKASKGCQYARETKGFLFFLFKYL